MQCFLTKLPSPGRNKCRQRPGTAAGERPSAFLLQAKYAVVRKSDRQKHLPKWTMSRSLMLMVHTAAFLSTFQKMMRGSIALMDL